MTTYTNPLKILISGIIYHIPVLTLTFIYNFRWECGFLSSPHLSLAESPSSLQTVHTADSQNSFQNFSVIFKIFDLPLTISVASMLAFLEYLHQNSISPKVIKNYLSSITFTASLYNLDPSAAFHPSILRFLKSISINSTFKPTPRGIFDLKTLYDISRACDSLKDPPPV